MKIRTITVGFFLAPEDFLGSSTDNLSGIVTYSLNLTSLKLKLQSLWTKITLISSDLQASYGYSIQTLRISLNPFEEWLLPCIEKYGVLLEELLRQFDELLASVGIDFCSFGCCNVGSKRFQQSSSMIPAILSVSHRFASSVVMENENHYNVAPKYDDCIVAAKTCLEVFQKKGNLGNFSYCVGFNCPSNIPFFPISYHDSSSSSDNSDHSVSLSSQKPLITIGLENGDLIFISFFGTTSHQEAKENLKATIKQAILPLQQYFMKVVSQYDLAFGGIDTSINPGLLLPDSIGQGIEQFFTSWKFPSIIPIIAQDGSFFGNSGTLSIISCITAALKELERDSELLLCGYNGLMLPIMEDIILATRASTIFPKPTFTMKDLLLFSTICGVGLDTIPIPGDSTPEEIASLYMDLGTIAYRLKKPLSCRLLPIKDGKVGDLTQIDSPYLVNTRIFSVK
jgi:uncharacterized protein (UPF0210 family)